MSYQKCPVCNGTGFSDILNFKIPCTVCLGMKIIDKATGKPPITTVDKPYNGTGDFRNANTESQKEYFEK